MVKEDFRSNVVLYMNEHLQFLSSLNEQVLLSRETEKKTFSNLDKKKRRLTIGVGTQ